MAKTSGFIAEFKQFIARGNVMDMAVGVIIGGAFKAIADSLVNDIINPVLGIFAGGNSDLAALVIHLPGGGDMMVGNFINAVFEFSHHGLCDLLHHQDPEPLPPQEGGGPPSPGRPAGALR